MKALKYIALALLITMSTAAEAKSKEKSGNVQVPHVYMFGFSASFTDSLVYLTDIQDIPNAWLDKKTKFLKERDNYSYQLKNYLTEQDHPNRVCVTFFATNKKKIEKKYQKLKKKYANTEKQKNKKRNKGNGSTAPSVYDVRYINAEEFRFEPIDLSE